MDAERMTQFEYDISKHDAGGFTQTAYFCSERGECRKDRISTHEEKVLVGILNERGTRGWELVQLFFGNDGLVAFWKRPL